MKIEAGKFYRTRDGRKVGPMEREATGFKGAGISTAFPEMKVYFLADGQRASIHSRDADLVSEWKPEPVVETVTIGGSYCKEDGWTFGFVISGDTHRITFTTKDGEPDCDSIKMERIDV